MRRAWQFLQNDYRRLNVGAFELSGENSDNLFAPSKRERFQREFQWKLALVSDDCNELVFYSLVTPVYYLYKYPRTK